ncbi:MAG: TPM domain-containing protein [Candidatus Woesearchaeota archaeon]|jgi:uncharacterized protein
MVQKSTKLKKIHTPKLNKYLILFIVFFIFLITIQPTNASINSLNSSIKINNYVIDNAGILSTEFKIALETVMIELEKETNGVQFVIYIDNIIPEGQSIEEYSLKLAEQNKLGKENNDNGLLLYIALDEREYRWETGYGLESTLNSALLGRISRAQLEPEFKEGNYEQGLFNVVNTTTYILLHSEDSDVKKMIDESQSSKKSSTTKIILLIIMHIAMLVIIWFIKKQRAKFLNNNINNKNNTNKNINDNTYITCASNIFTNSFNKGNRGSGGFSGGGGSFGGGGHSGKW